MSLDVMARVWDKSPAAHGNLLLLLAIADAANENGEACVSRAYLAAKSRLTERAVQLAVAALVKDGELTVKRGHNRCNRYVVTRAAEVRK